jgi:hypothetical protein
MIVRLQIDNQLPLIRRLVVFFEQFIQIVKTMPNQGDIGGTQ